ncbi:MAG: hypothetical protein J2P21_12320 [Chloracidobacterium sp.]|nr:hypothetical protein [Chloracidobacterium sp.]
MTEAKGIQFNSIYKLGKAAALRDERNLRLAAILREQVSPPDEYDFDVAHKGVPTPMFGNDRYGDCVIAGRAHQTLRFELVEQNQLIMIAEEDVTKEYFKQTGGEDIGLNVLKSLNAWRKKGWQVAKQRYKIKAFAEVSPSDHEEIKRAVYLDIGVGVGLTLPKTAEEQFAAGKPWDVVNGPDSAPNSWGGHYVYIPGYTDAGPVCVTWGRKHQITWAFVDKYCDEAYAIIDGADTLKKKRGLDAKKIDTFLASL